MEKAADMANIYTLCFFICQQCANCFAVLVFFRLLPKLLFKTRSLGALRASGPQYIAGGPSGLLTSSFAPFRHFGRVTHAANL